MNTVYNAGQHSRFAAIVPARLTLSRMLEVKRYCIRRWAGLP